MPYTRFVDVRRAISLFATIPSPKAELALIELVKKIPINFKYIIERLAWRGRVSTLTVKSIGDIELLYIKKEAFDSITEDLPGVLRAVVSVLASYVHEH